MYTKRNHIGWSLDPSGCDVSESATALPRIPDLPVVLQALTLLALPCSAENLPPPGSLPGCLPPLSSLFPLSLSPGCSGNTILTFPDHRLHLSHQLRWFLDCPRWTPEGWLSGQGCEACWTGHPAASPQAQMEPGAWLLSPGGLPRNDRSEGRASIALEEFEKHRLALVPRLEDFTNNKYS